MIRLEIKNCNTILTKKQQEYQHYYLEKLKKILPSDQKIVIKQAKFAYSSLEKASERPTETIEDQGKKQIKAIEEHGKQLI